MYVCMYVCKPVWKVAMVNGLRGPLGWSLVRIASQAAVLPCTTYRRATSAPTVPYPTLLYTTLIYPTLTYPTLLCPAVPLFLCVCCVSLLCVSDLTYLSPFVSLSLCYCSWGGRPSIVQPFMAIPRPVRSSSSRERTSPRRTM
jgi:hypothetical protein